MIWEFVLEKMPSIVIDVLFDIYHHTILKTRYYKLLRYYKKQTGTVERQIASDIKNKGIIDLFYGDWSRKYDRKKYKIKRDGKYCYVDHRCIDGKRRKMYFKRSMKEGFAEFYYRALDKEQDKQSPHCYLTEDFIKELNSKSRDGIVLDIGAAEGVFALDLTGYYKKCYLFEPDENWLRAMRRTFKGRKEDIKIVPAFVADKSGDRTISIDEFFGNNIPNNISIIKMDIEGFETSALLGMKRTLENNPQAILLVCAYHKKNDEKDIKNILEPLGYKVVAREGYMFVWIAEDFEPPYQRHAVLEVRKV